MSALTLNISIAIAYIALYLQTFDSLRVSVRLIKTSKRRWLHYLHWIFCASLIIFSIVCHIEIQELINARST